MLQQILPLLLLPALGCWADSGELSQTTVADVVLDCWFLEEGGSRSVGIGVAFSRKKSLLVLRNVSVSSQADPDSASSFFQIPEGDDEVIVVDVDTSGVSIPDGEAWLHADCAGEPVECELGALEGEAGAGRRYLASLQLPASNLGMTLMLLGTGAASRVVPTSVEFLVHTRTSRIRTRLGRPVVAHCAQEGLPGAGISAEWRRQHQGAGRRLYVLSGGEGRPEAEGAWLDEERARAEGLLSLRIDSVGVREEGTYICAVSGRQGQAQQTSLVEVMEPPQVRVFAQPMGSGPRVLLVCEATRFFPLELDIAWVTEPPGEEPVPVQPLVYGSHRRNRDGTFNLSAEVALEGWPDDRPPPLYTCLVTHPALETPLSVSIRPQRPADETAGYLRVVYQGLLLSALLLLAAMYLRRGNRAAPEMPVSPGPEKTTEDGSERRGAVPD